MTLHEPAVTLTDYFLAIECAVFAVMLWRRSKPEAGPARAGFVRLAFICFFAAASGASLFGGTVHGFLPDASTWAHRGAWAATLLSIGATALAATFAAVGLGWGVAAARRLGPVLFVAFAAYVAVVVWVRRDFVVAIAGYAPATVLLLAVLVGRWRRQRAPGAAVGIVALLLTFAAALVQQGGWGLHPTYFDHNALYHLIQALALYLLFRCALAIENAT